MKLNNIFFISTGVVLATIIIVLIIRVMDSFKKEKSKLSAELEEYKKEYIDNINDVGFKIMSANLLELKEYYIMTKIQYERTFKITTFFSSVGCIIILLGAIYGAISKDFEVTKYTIISGGVSEGVAALAFWMFTQAKNQLNLYSQHLRQNEKVLCTLNVIDKMSNEKKDELIDKLVTYLLKDKDV